MVSRVRRVRGQHNTSQHLRRVREERKNGEGRKCSGRERVGVLTIVLLRAQFTGVPPTLCRVLAAAALGLRGVESFGH